MKAFKLKKTFLLILIGGVLLSIFLTGCSSNNPTYINNALFYADSSNFIIQFDVLNQNKETIITEGNLNVKIVDGAGNLYYEKSIPVSESNKGIRNTLNGEIVDTHIVKIDADDVKSLSTIYYGLYAKIKYSTNNIQFEELELPYNEYI